MPSALQLGPEYLGRIGLSSELDLMEYLQSPFHHYAKGLFHSSGLSQVWREHTKPTNNICFEDVEFN